MSLRKSKRKRENSTIESAITDVGSEPKDADQPSTDAQSKDRGEADNFAVEPGFFDWNVQPTVRLHTVVNYAKQGERKLVCASSSILNDLIARSGALKGVGGTYLHVDWVYHAGGTATSIMHAVNAVYGKSEAPVDLVVEGVGINDLSQGNSVENIMSRLHQFKNMVLAIAPGHWSGPSTFAVCTPPHPPAFTRYGPDNHAPQRDLTEEFVSLTNRITILNLESGQLNEITRHPPMFHRFGVHMYTTAEQKERLKRRGQQTEAREAVRPTRRPADHRYNDWRELVRSDKIHLNDKKIVSMAKAVVSYFRDLHHDGVNHLMLPNHIKRKCTVCMKTSLRD